MISSSDPRAIWAFAQNNLEPLGRSQMRVGSPVHRLGNFQVFLLVAGLGWPGGWL